MHVVGKISQLLVPSPVLWISSLLWLACSLAKWLPPVLYITALSPFASYPLISDKLFLCLFDAMPREEVQVMGLMCREPGPGVTGCWWPGPVTFGWEEGRMNSGELGCASSAQHGLCQLLDWPLAVRRWVPGFELPITFPGRHTPHASKRHGK